VIKQNSVDIKG